MARIKEFAYLIKPGHHEFDVPWKLLEAGLALSRFLERANFELSPDEYPLELRDLLLSVYRPLKRAVAYYHGEDSPLSYCAPAPGKPFAKAAK
jgi:hypothetical protein